MSKRGQAAMEFLMTYGWAILVVLAAVGALAYFGVLSPSRFIPEKCILPGGIVCIDSAATTTAITIALQNSAGFDINGVSVTINGDSATGPAALANGVSGTYATSSTYSSGSKISGNFQVMYTNNQTGLPHTKTGDIVIQIP